MGLFFCFEYENHPLPTQNLIIVTGVTIIQSVSTENAGPSISVIRDRVPRKEDAAKKNLRPSWITISALRTVQLWRLLESTRKSGDL